MSSFLVSVKNISFKRDDITIFEGASLSIKKGNIISIIGLNGSGKSTFLKILSKLEKQTQGEIIFQKGIKISYMPQKLHISKHLPMCVSDFLKIKIKNLDIEIFDKLNIRHLFSKNIAHISGGEVQKVLFAFTIIGNNDLLILDEPEQNLDVMSKKILYELMLEYSNYSGIIIASHDKNIIFNKSTSILHFNQSKVVHYENIKENCKCNDTLFLFEKHFKCDYE